MCIRDSIYPDTDFPKRFLQMKYGYIDGKKYEVAAARLHKRVVLMKFVGVDDRNAAELLRGKELQVPREDLMPLKEGQHYICLLYTSRKSTPRA